MKKAIVYLLIALTLVSLCAISIPKVSSQTQFVKILSYNYYFDNAGFIDIVGEVQNQGPNYEAPVVVAGSVYDSSHSSLAANSALIGTDIAPVNYLAPGQKAPFYVELPPPMNSPNGSWYSQDVQGVDVYVYLANATQTYSYSDLKISQDHGSLGTIKTGNNADFGVYWVTGNVQNTGTQTAQNVTVLATFYNSTGGVVAVGSTNTTNIGNLAPSKSASFKLGAFDINQTGLQENFKIASYSLLVVSLNPTLKTSNPIITPDPNSTTPPTSSTPNSNVPTGSPTSTESSGSTNKPSGLSSTVIAIIAVAIVAVLVGIGAFLLMRTRKPGVSTKEKIKQKRR